MTKLTEGMILARCRGAELDTIRKLNCWGSELSDISIVKRMPALEVLSLSVNNIGTLADLQNSRMLQELYIRKNNIRDLAEIMYLKELRKLKCLWLADNPCAEVEGYRLTVLKHLPQIQKLDNVDVEPEEIREAQDRGLDLVHPLDRQAGVSYTQPYTQPQSYQTNGPSPNAVANKPPVLTGAGSNTSLSSRTSSCSLLEQPIAEDRELVLPATHNSVPSPASGGLGSVATNGASSTSSPSPVVTRRQPLSNSSGSRDSLVTEKQYEPPQPPAEAYEYEEVVPQLPPTAPGRRVAPASAPPSRKASHAEMGGGDGYSVRRYSQMDSQQDTPRMLMSYGGMRRTSVAEEPQRIQEDYVPYQVDYAPEYNHQLQQQQQRQQQVEEQLRREEMRRQAGQQYAEAYHQAAEQIESYARNPNASPTRARPKHRSSNILSAVLCLLKELDVRSLEVVEMSARGRIEELLED